VSAEGEPDVCEPWPASGRATCDAGEAHFPGTPGCAVVGAPCPAGDFADDLPATGDVRFVLAGAPAGGTGARDAPFATIAEALAGASSGTVVALGKGTYEEIVRVPLGVTLHGACAGETRIFTDALSIVGEGVIHVSERGVVVRNVSIGGAREGIVVAGPRGALEVHGVVVDGAARSGMRVGPNAELTGGDLAIRNVAVAEERYGYGLAVGPGSTVSLSRVAIERATSAAVATLDASVVLEDAVLADGEAQPVDGRLGAAIEALGGANVTVRRAVLEGNTDRALMPYEAGTMVVVEDSVVRGTRARPRDDGEGRAAFVFEGATLVLRRTLVEDNREVAILAIDEGTRAELEDVVVRRTVVDAAGEGGTGLAVQSAAGAFLSRVAIVDNHTIGLFAGSASTLTANDVLVARTESAESDGRFGTGVLVQGGSHLDGARLAIRDNRQAGLAVLEPGSSAVLTDVEVTGTRERACAPTTCPDLGLGDGVLSAIDATIDITRLLIRDNARAGVHVGGGAIDLHEGLVERNPIGAAVQVPGFDTARLNDGVLYRDNDRNFDMRALPLPEPSTGF
jgi:hypothetical protein